MLHTSEKLEIRLEEEICLVPLETPPYPQTQIASQSGNQYSQSLLLHIVMFLERVLLLLLWLHGPFGLALASLERVHKAKFHKASLFPISAM
jgi:hypothetical protein